MTIVITYAFTGMEKTKLLLYGSTMIHIPELHPNIQEHCGIICVQWI
jgi:hypothetical protein